jgi:hypothetical protein
MAESIHLTQNGWILQGEHCLGESSIITLFLERAPKIAEILAKQEAGLPD